MKRILVTVSVWFGLLNAASAAPDPVPPTNFAGSDTLRDVTLDVINSCQGGLGGVMNYLGGGSTAGANAMVAGDQQVAPMSRFLKAGAECGGLSNTGQGCRVGLDGIGIYADDEVLNHCDTIRYTDVMQVTERNGVAGIQCPSCDTNNVYTFQDWRDVLRVVYAGQTAHIDQPACSDADPPRSALATRDCNSDVRRELLSNWGNIFEGGCTDARCTQLRHAFRRDDLSGTTDTFLTLLALPAVTDGNGQPQRTFCNGLENEDLDPIRRACDTNEQVCANLPFANRAADPSGGNPPGHASDPGSSGIADLGVVLPISLPTDATKQYDNRFCTSVALGGTFKLAPMPAALSLEAQRCPDGNARSAGKCRWPVHFQDGKFNCIARTRNRPGGITFPNFDGRAYNLIPRDPLTGVILQNNLAGTRDPRWGGGGHYRLQQTLALTGGVGPCAQPSATDQIGCLVHASPCSVGFAGLQASQQLPAKALMLRTPLPIEEGGFESTPDFDSIRLLLEEPNAVCLAGQSAFDLRYPLARSLFLTAQKGFGTNFSNITNSVDSTDPSPDLDLLTREKDFAQCYCSRKVTDRFIDQNGFVTLTETVCATTSSDPDCGALPIKACGQ
jgi:hypothetical protein